MAGLSDEDHEEIVEDSTQFFLDESSEVPVDNVAEITPDLIQLPSKSEPVSVSQRKFRALISKFVFTQKRAFSLQPEAGHKATGRIRSGFLNLNKESNRVFPSFCFDSVSNCEKYEESSTKASLIVQFVLDTRRVRASKVLVLIAGYACMECGQLLRSKAIAKEHLTTVHNYQCKSKKKSRHHRHGSVSSTSVLAQGNYPTRQVMRLEWYCPSMWLLNIPFDSSRCADAEFHRR